MPLQHTHVIDLIALDPATDELVLGMIEPRPWDGSDRRVYELQEKVNTYLSFALDGEMAENFPQFAGKIVRLQLECAEEPDPKTVHFVEIIREQIGFQGLRFAVRVAPELAEAVQGECCGGGCGCENHAEGQMHGYATEGGDCCGGAGQGGCGCS